LINFYLIDTVSSNWLCQILNNIKVIYFLVIFSNISIHLKSFFRSPKYSTEFFGSQIAANDLCMNSKGLKTHLLSVKHLAKFTIFLLKLTRKIVNFSDFVKRTKL